MLLPMGSVRRNISQSPFPVQSFRSFQVKKRVREIFPLIRTRSHRGVSICCPLNRVLLDIYSDRLINLFSFLTHNRSLLKSAFINTIKCLIYNSKLFTAPVTFYCIVNVFSRQQWTPLSRRKVLVMLFLRVTLCCGF